VTTPLPKTAGIETYYFSEPQKWVACWLPYHWGFRGWGDSEEEAVADLKRHHPYKAAELAAKDAENNTRMNQNPTAEGETHE